MSTSRPKKILFLTLKTFSKTGGIEKFNRCFARALEENAITENWEIRVLSAYDDNPDAQYISAKYFKGFAGNKALFFFNAIREAAKADTIVFGHINLAILIKLTRLFFGSKKLILVTHGIEVWRSLSTIQSSALQQCDLIASVSRFTAKKLVDEKQVPEKKIRIFPNTLDPWFGANTGSIKQPDLRQRYGLMITDKVILTVSRLSSTEQQKGYDSIIKAMPAVLKKYPSTKFLLCGKPDPSESDRLSQLIVSLQLRGSVILTGFIPDDELLAHYQLADMFAMPSRKEGFGIVFIEAAWLGLPVIAGNRDGSADALLDGELGVLIDPDDQQALENAIISLLDFPLSAQEKTKRQLLVDTHFGFKTFKRRQANLLSS